MKISKKLREQAAMICAMKASVESIKGSDQAREFADAVGFGEKSVDVAYAAWSWQVDHDYQDHQDNSWCREAWAEAEAMLRTGWTP